LSTSGSLLFQSAQNEQIIREAYERVGISLLEIQQEEIEAAQRSLNFLLSALPNRQLNLWTVSQEMMCLNPNQNTYDLPEATSDVLEVFARYSVRNAFIPNPPNGTPNGQALSDPGGVANNAFDGNRDTACTQTGPNGNINYQWLPPGSPAGTAPTQYSIQLVGVQSNADLTYTLSFEFSNDGAAWTRVLLAAPQLYPRGQIVWFNIPIPVLGGWFRVVETGNATLNIQELYFNTSVNDTELTRASRSEYLSYPSKFTNINTPASGNSARPSTFIVWRTIHPTISIYPTPSSFWNCLFYSRIVMPQDIGSLTNTPPVPSRFFEALACGLAVKLCFKKNVMDRYEALKLEYNEEFKYAFEEDKERVPLRLYSDFSYGYTQQ
jgi:hypothetical protein